MPAEKPWWDWGDERPRWEPFPQRPPASPPRIPGHEEDIRPRVIAVSEGGDTRAIERELERRRRELAGKNPPPPGQIEPPWSGDEGTDRCAWYLSFRYGREFGIYICIECIDQIAGMLWRHGMDYEYAQRVAFTFLYGHEQFHYRVDRGVELLEQSLEVATGRATSLWLQRWVTSRFHRRGHGIDLLEEACANQQGLAAALKEIGSSPKKKSKQKVRDKSTIARDKSIAERVLSAMMKASGPGYRCFEDVSRPYTALAHDDLMSLFLLLDASGTGKPVGPVAGLSRVIPRPVRKGNLGIDPEVPLYLSYC